MKPELLQLEVLSVEGMQTQLKDIYKLRIRLEDGSWLGILPGHAPLIGATSDGLLYYQADAEEQSLELRSGLLSIRDNVVSILTTH